LINLKILKILPTFFFFIKFIFFYNKKAHWDLKRPKPEDKDTVSGEIKLDTSETFNNKLG
jgi:hypothetical protein